LNFSRFSWPTHKETIIYVHGVKMELCHYQFPSDLIHVSDLMSDVLFLEVSSAGTFCKNFMEIN
jgi:hypothetical protein